MDVNVILQIINTVGFPVACVVAMAWYVYNQTEKNRQQISDMQAQHKAEMDGIKEALNNNTLALTRLCEHLEK